MNETNQKKIKDSIIKLSLEINNLERAIEAKIKKNKNLIKFKEITQSNLEKEALFKKIEDDINSIEKIIESK